MNATTPSAAEQAVYAYAEQFPTPNVLRALRAAQDGIVTWAQVERVFATATAKALSTLTGARQVTMRNERRAADGTLVVESEVTYPSV